MSNSLRDPDDEIVVKPSGEASLDDLIAGLEATWQGIGAAKTQAEPASARPVEEPPPSPAPAQQIERRGAERREPHEFKAELRLAVAGFPMRLVNLSATGLLAETNQRLCPGRTVDVFLRYGGVRKVLRATVIRSSMHAVAPTPVFRAALQFEDTLALQDADL
jgi:PilZ domain